MNNAFTPMVSELSMAGLEQLLAYPGSKPIIHTVAEELAGFALALPPGLDYQSLNYQWFERNVKNYFYLDRIFIAKKFQRTGLGKKIYLELFESLKGDYQYLTCEVNLKPLNQISLDFHRKLGFKEVGQQDTDGGKKRVSLLALKL